MSEASASFGALRALCQRHDEPFEHVCALLEAWPDAGELARVALPYAVDHVRRWSRPRPAPLRWRVRLVRGERCPELAVCDELDLRFVRDLILPPSHTELADILSSADELSGIRTCRVDLLEPGWADAMPGLERLSLLGCKEEEGSPWRALADFIEGVPGVRHIDLHGVPFTERDLHQLDADAPGGALDGVGLFEVGSPTLDGALDWLCARAPELKSLELSGLLRYGSQLSGEAIHELIAALDAHDDAIKLETFAATPTSPPREFSLRFDERWGRLRRFGMSAPAGGERIFNQLFLSPHTVNLEELWLGALESVSARRFIESNIASELRRLCVRTSRRPEVRWTELLGGAKSSDLEDLGLRGYAGYDELNALAQNHYMPGLRALEVMIPWDLKPEQWNELFASPGFARIERLSVSGESDRQGNMRSVLDALERNLALPSLRHLIISDSEYVPLSIERETRIDTLSVFECHNGDGNPIGPRIHGSLCHTLRRLVVGEEWSLPSHVDTILTSCPELEVLVTEGEDDDTHAELEALRDRHDEAGVIGLRRIYDFGADDPWHGTSRSVFDWSSLEPL